MKENKNTLPMPNFLAFNFDGFNFELNKQITKTPDCLPENVLKKYNNPNTIVLLNGEIVINNLTNGVVASSNLKSAHAKNYVESVSYDYITNQNKQSLNSFLHLEFLQNQTQNVEVVFAISQDTAHFSEYVVAANSNIVINESFVVISKAKLNYVCNTSVDKDANLSVVQMQTIANNQTNSFSHFANTAENANYNLTYLNLNSGNIVNNAQVKLNGFASTGNVNSISFATKKYKFASLINITHLNKNTVSNINNVGIVNHNAQLSIDGVGVIEKGYSKSVAEQETHIVNLTDTAKSIANPQLIINEYDVKAGHAAAVGRIDEEQLYYLMSRGLTKGQSTELLLMAYVNEILEGLNNKNLAKQIIKIIKSKIK